METAHCISISTGLLAAQDKVWQIERITNGGELKQIMRGFRDAALPQQVVQLVTQSYFLLIDGISLTEATKPDSIEDFLALAMQASCVCCCRCAPSQKREITSKLKQLGERVLGIGDGGNDVGMIQEAHVGVGIAGKEGKQAALASDYSINEFQ